MKIRELIRFSKGLLEGRRARTIMICLLPLGAEMFFRCAEATVYCILLYFGEYDPIVLFSGRNALQLTTAAMCSLLRWVTAAPLMYCAAYRLYGMTAGSPKKKHEALSRVLFRKCTFKRSISAVLWTKVIGLLALAPAVFCGMTAFDLLHGKLGAQETFLAVNAVVLGVISVFLWLSLKLSFAAVPFLLVRSPKMTAFRTVLYSIKFMSGRKSVLLRLLAVYVPQMLTILLIPFAFTKLMTAFSLSIDIFIKEDEYLETDRTDGGRGNSCDTGKVSTRKKRSFKTAADKA